MDPNTSQPTLSFYSHHAVQQYPSVCNVTFNDLRRRPVLCLGAFFSKIASVWQAKCNKSELGVGKTFAMFALFPARGKMLIPG